MIINIRVEVERVEGKNLAGTAVAEHICANLIRPGELPAEPGLIWPGADGRGRGGGSQYRIVSAQPNVATGE